MIEELGTQPVVDIIESYGGWPVVKGDSWDESIWTWVEAVKKSRKYGYGIKHIFSISVSSDSKNSTKRIIEIDQASFAIFREYLVKGMNDTIVQAYLSFMVDIAVLFGANKDKALKEMQESLNFEFALANVSLHFFFI